MMTADTSITDQIIAKAESFPEIHAGVARVEAVLNSPSYRATPSGEWPAGLSDSSATVVLPDSGFVLVMALRHPADNPELDWWEYGNTQGNLRLMAVSESLKLWLEEEHGLESKPLPYYLEKGGIFLKDAAVLAGLGIIGRNNLLQHPEWGPQIRLRSILIAGDLQPSEPLEDFCPCDACPGFCQEACPQNAFSEGVYNRADCLRQMNADMANKLIGGVGSSGMVVKYCRECELACPF